MLRPLFVSTLAALVFAAQQIPPVTVLRIVAGPAGTESRGSFALIEERDVFSRTSDREAVVVFQWEDLPGRHVLGATWRSPDGGATTASTIDYIASETRFGAVWRLPITPGMPLGRWSVDATVDGRPAGRYSFELTDAAVQAADIRRPLTEAQLHERLGRVFVILQRATRSGTSLGPSAGFLPVPGEGRVVTVMPAVDGADALHALLPDGGRHPIDRLIAYDRRQQWAVLDSRGGHPGEALVRANYDEVTVGSRCFAMEGTADGVRVLVMGTVSGQLTTNGRRILIVSFADAFGMPGAPVVDEYGRLLGVLGAGVPGDPRPLEYVTVSRGALRGAPLLRVPDDAQLATGTHGGSLAQLRMAGAVMPSALDRHVMSAGFVAGAVKALGARIDFDAEFRRNGEPFTLVVEWSAVERVRGQAMVTVFDADGKPQITSKPRKVDLKPRQVVSTAWPLTATLAAGTYRTDVTIDGVPYWRGFFRINE